ncbi:MAG: hypothetical protein HC822_02305 [Oscillochloris sp.]|nr:hypothetical protein [Oscillochloris sp.]
MARTTFRPEEHGFAFVNSFELQIGERDEIKRTLHGGVGGATHSVSNDLSGLSQSIVGMLSRQITTWVDGALPDYYGMCGGMAFAAADHFHARRKLPRGSDYHDIPNDKTPAGRALREYLWQRQMESFGPNVPQLLTWMMMLHLPFGFAGPTWLCAQTRHEFGELKRHLDHDQPWPICLVGSSRSPFDNHQVLAIGYEESGVGTATIYLYDMNCPGREQTIGLSMGGPELIATESCASPARGRLRGFFCEHYEPKSPPDLPGWGA